MNFHTPGDVNERSLTLRDIHPLLKANLSAQEPPNLENPLRAQRLEDVIP